MDSKTFDVESATRLYLKNRMRDKWYGITHFVPEFLQGDWLWKLWSKYMCPNGWHLLDEVQSVESHYLFCDACGLSVPLENITDKDSIWV